MDPLDSQYEHFVVAEWRNKYADRVKLKSAFNPLRKHVEDYWWKDPFEGVDIDGVENVIVGAAQASASSQELPESPVLLGKARSRSRGSRGSLDRGGSMEEAQILLIGIDLPKNYESISGGTLRQDQVQKALKVFIENVIKVAAFHDEILRELQQTFAMLKTSRRKQVQAKMSPTRRIEKSQSKKQQYEMEEDSLRRAYIDLYRHLKFLESYDGLNYTMMNAFVQGLSKSLESYLDSKSFTYTSILQVLILEVEESYAAAFCGGNLVQARTKLLLKQTHHIDAEQLNFGVYLGVCLTMMIWLFWDATIDNSRLWQHGSLTTTPAYPIFRGIFSYILTIWAWGLSNVVWSRFRINYIYMFQLDPRTMPTVRQIFVEATRTTVFFFATFLLYFKTILGTFPEWVRPGIYPLMLSIYIIVNFFRRCAFPREVLHAIFKVCTSPWSEVTFLAIFICDWMTSLVKPEMDWIYGTCYFGKGVFLSENVLQDSNAMVYQCAAANNSWIRLVISPIVCALPLWFRFIQCLRRTYDSGERFPHLANALKYSLAMIVVLLSAFHPFDRHEEGTMLRSAWISIFCISGLYSFCWDVFMDWSLGRPQYGFLSDKLMYPRRDLYYFAIVIDFFLRFSWVLTLVDPGTVSSFLRLSIFTHDSLSMLVQTSIQMTEIFRRTMWGFFRLENEHLRNTLHFRTSNFIPLHFDAVYQDDQDLASSKANGSTSTAGGNVRQIELYLLTGLVLAAAFAIVLSRFWNDLHNQDPHQP